MPERSDHALTDFFPVFAAGEHTDSSGRTTRWSRDDLDEMVATHAAIVEERGLYAGAPLVIGHPEMDDPAWGWVEELRRDGDLLYARAAKVEPTFESLVAEGRYPNRSVRVVRTDKGLTIGHVGFLGARPPAVEGLAPVHDHAAGREVVGDYAIEPDWYTPGVLARVMRRLRDWIVERDGRETADSIIPDYEIEAITEHAADQRRTTEPEGAMYAAPEPDTGDHAMPEVDQAAIEAAREEERRAAAEREQALRAELEQARRLARRAEFAAWLESTPLTAAQQQGVIDFMLSLDAEQEHDFAAADGATVRKTALDFFRDFVARLEDAAPPAGEELAGPGSAPPAGAVAQFAGPGHQPVDADRLALHQRALDYMAAHDGVDYIDAVRAVEQQEA